MRPLAMPKRDQSRTVANPLYVCFGRFHYFAVSRSLSRDSFAPLVMPFNLFCRFWRNILFGC